MKTRLTILITCLTISLFSQNPGDQIFNEDQVLTIELQFSQPSFWDSLVAYYATETYMEATLTATDNSGIYTFPGVGIRLKGNSSYGHPGDKKSFKIDINRYNDSLEYDGLRKLNFNNCFKDPTFMREKIIYDICKADGINAPRANYANVYFNDIFWGFYEVVEQVDDEFLKTHFDDKSENLFKAGDAFGMGGPSDAADLLYYGTDQSDYEGKYTLENNEDENNWSDLFDLLNFINNTTDEEFSSGLSAHFNVEQLMKSFALHNLFSNLDSYLNSARNYYIYNKDSSGVWEWINWDCNEAFGSYTGGAAGALTEMNVYYYSLNRPLLERILTIEATKTQYENYYCELKSNYFNSIYLDPQIDDLYNLIQPFVYADDNKMYSNADFETNIESDITGGGGPGGGTIYGLKSFTEARSAFLESALSCEQETAVNQTFENEMKLFPNPAQDFIYLCPGMNSIREIFLSDINGKLISQHTSNGGSIMEINITGLPPGIYLISVVNEDGNSNLRFVKN